jgi:hypothetical protein
VLLQPRLQGLQRRLQHLQHSRVPERALLTKLATALDGVARVRVLGGYVPQRERPRWGARRTPDPAHAN